MFTAEEVSAMAAEWKASGMDKYELLKNIGKSCLGWPYVFGAWGELCTPANRKRRARAEYPTIISKCQVLNGNASSCTGCQWGGGVRMYDCRGFVKWLLEQAGVISLEGQGATSQYNTKSNWSIRGKISDMPVDRIQCVFMGNTNKKDHIGLYTGDGYVLECAAGVQRTKFSTNRWSYYASPLGLYEGEGGGETVGKPTLRRGSVGVYVVECQETLLAKGYSVGSKGADGKYGPNTQTAVKQFQQDHDLVPDGICGPLTWAALEQDTGDRYTVHIPHLPEVRAKKLVDENQDAWMEKEE